MLWLSGLTHQIQFLPGSNTMEVEAVGLSAVARRWTATSTEAVTAETESRMRTRTG
jgi:hypothetical protein